jgi:leucyl-tRNA synthetase
MILGEVEHTAYVAGDGSWVSRQHVGDKLDETGEEKPYDTRTGAWVTPKKMDAADLVKKGGDFVLASDESIVVDARAHKMSKSRGNVVNPDDIIKQYGADSLRLYEMFMGPIEATKPWSTASIPGVRRFLDRAHAVSFREIVDGPTDDALLRTLHRAIKKVGEDIAGMRFNTAISTLMQLVNELYPIEKPSRFAIETLALLLHPLAPHLGEEIWERLGHTESVQRAPWPSYDPKLCVDDEVEIPVQVNGKVRGRVKVPAGAAEDVVVALAMKDENVQKHLEGKELVKRQYVAGRILTLVVK